MGRLIIFATVASMMLNGCVVYSTTEPSRDRFGGSRTYSLESSVGRFLISNYGPQRYSVIRALDSGESFRLPGVRNAKVVATKKNSYSNTQLILLNAAYGSCPQQSILIHLSRQKRFSKPINAKVFKIGECYSRVRFFQPKAGPLFIHEIDRKGIRYSISAQNWDPLVQSPRTVLIGGSTFNGQTNYRNNILRNNPDRNTKPRTEENFGDYSVRRRPPKPQIGAPNYATDEDIAKESELSDSELAPEGTIPIPDVPINE